MKPKLFALALLALLFHTASAADILPNPREYTRLDGSFSLNSHTAIACDNEVRDIAQYLTEYIPLRRFTLADKGSNRVALRLDNSLASEEYRLDVQPNGITNTGGDYGGGFNGVQSLLQLLPPTTFSKALRLPASVPCCHVADRPRFAYRGLLLDVARTWISADRVKRYIDLLAYHKINKLHFHLTDDEGWRIEILSHPELARTGGFRGGDSPVHPRYAKFGEKWGGYYTQQELRDIVEYARVRNIEVIPEIDMPGHSKALGAIRHDILCNFTPDTTLTNGLDIRNVWCAAKESNYALIDDIIREVSGIFSSRYIHIGGDEVDMSQWRQCPDCQRLKKERGLADEKQIEDYFIARVTAILARYGKLPAVWNEAINGGTLPSDTRVHGWQGVRHCLRSTEKGYPTIVMPGEYFYFDMKQSDGEAGHNWAAIFDAQKVLSFDLAKSGFTDRHIANVAGIEASFFSEIYIAHAPERNDYLDYMLFPRLCAFAEVAWSNDKRDWESFYRALRSAHYDRMQAMGIVFRLSTPAVTYADGKLTASTDDGATIYYTDSATGRSVRYTEPLACDEPWRIAFHSEYGTARSRTTGSAEYLAVLTPQVVVTTSMPCRKSNPIENAATYSNRIARTTRAAHAGDWIQYTFAQPLSCRQIEAQTGHIHLCRCHFLAGYVEVSSDGQTFTRVADLVDGGAVFAPHEKIRAVRICATSRSDAEDNVVIQSLKIK